MVTILFGLAMKERKDKKKEQDVGGQRTSVHQLERYPSGSLYVDMVGKFYRAILLRQIQ